jgi:hypothetical protein
MLNFEHAGFNYVAGIGRYEDGRLGEVFLNVAKTGTAVETMAHDLAVTISIALQHGAPIETLRRALKRERDGSAAGPIGRLLDLIAAEQAAP